jgi:membrane protein
MEFLNNVVAKLKLPFWNGISLWELAEIYYRFFKKSNLIIRAKAISWSLFLSFFPFLIFIFSLIPFMPHFEEIQEKLYELVIQRFLPEKISFQLYEFIQDIIKNKFTFQPISILLTLYFATGGIYSLINGFSSKNHKINIKNNLVINYIISMCITIIVVVSVLASLLLFYYTEIVWKYIEFQEVYTQIQSLSGVFSWLYGLILYFFGVLILYYFGSQKTLRVKECFPGSILALIFSILITYGFAFYVVHFMKFNALYGSLGSVFILMLWIFLNVLLILIGFEVNIIIKNFHKHTTKSITG